MSLREQLFLQAGEALPQRVAHANGSAATTSAAYQQVAMDIHQTIIDRVELGRLQQLEPDQVKRELAQLVERIIDEGKHQLNEAERRRLVSDVQDEMLGYGPLEPLLADPTISDILVNTYKHVYVERRGKLELTSVTFHDDAHLMRVIEKMVSRVGRRIDESSPMVDARLPDGSRINAIIPPSAIDGPLLSIRRFAVNPLTIQDLVGFRTLTPEMAQLLDAMVKAKLNILISGGTGSGKTTLLNILSGYIPADERIVTIEDAAELQLRQNHVLRLETRPVNIEGRGEITQRALVKNALRMRPDRIILGEVRGAEALDMLHAMNTGHEGSLATIHANTPRDALTRLENMISMAGLSLPTKTMRQQITSALTVVVQVSRLTDGFRKLVSVQEITGMEGEVVNMQEIFAFRRKGIDRDGRIKGHFCATGVRPKFSERLQAFGIHLPESLYDPSVQYEV
ncbi:CpaF family protein [Ralstonia syzygii subsp. celebesensis]|uniref:Pilus assembly protein CpaF n=3 Tax=Ralstonia solanacearum species complex TaxID=3116862 RepID=A0AAD0S8D8_RALSL|nr:MULTISPECIES: CpaF family protein [Ralstonia solanacearum species complex]CCA81054.1 Tad secretion sytem protein, secretion ATPase [blood disease bacterium R229]AQW30470.1 pilus assembly protein CpaF [blood disease bacterium A2-HR MARDI]AXV82441.1 pilus assembly protein CpaF [Ralstonia solanacearum]AXW53564.1 pilus assembly protein CpaF [Ralstonia solanacearum]QQV55701.1 CpaF family protein [Ralstonia syzygii subsp. celebesensis]